VIICLLTVVLVPPSDVFVETCRADDVCVSNQGSPTICVNWDEPSPPEEGEDFDVDFECPTCSDYPNLQLRTGSLTWRVYSKDESTPSNPGDMGHLTSDPTRAGNYAVTLRRADTTAGARDMKSFVLKPNFPHYQTNIIDSVVTGSIEGDVTV